MWISWDVETCWRSDEQTLVYVSNNHNQTTENIKTFSLTETIFSSHYFLFIFNLFINTNISNVKFNHILRPKLAIYVWHGQYFKRKIKSYFLIQMYSLTKTFFNYHYSFVNLFISDISNVKIKACLSINEPYMYEMDNILKHFFNYFF